LAVAALVATLHAAAAIDRSITYGSDVVAALDTFRTSAGA
jgi:hypothetical protein